jgi:hypothetical protein
MMKAVARIFRAGAGPSGLDEEACAGGDQIIDDILARLNRVRHAWDTATEQNWRAAFRRSRASLSALRTCCPVAKRGGGFSNQPLLDRYH